MKALKAKHVIGVIVWALVFGLVTSTVRAWTTETPASLDVKSVVINMNRNEAVQIPVPEMNHAYTVEVYSVVDPIPKDDRDTVMSTPRIVYKQGYAELSQVMIPPLLAPGTYTVVLHVSYRLNPMKLVQQSALIAVLIVNS
ncbi:hypothetical protein [Burkholderia phage BCSR5]|nr:hypothetical protein [Burkholderia phage BCSR5]